MQSVFSESEESTCRMSLLPRRVGLPRLHETFAYPGYAFEHLRDGLNRFEDATRPDSFESMA